MPSASGADISGRFLDTNNYLLGFYGMTFNTNIGGTSIQFSQITSFVMHSDVINQPGCYQMSISLPSSTPLTKLSFTTSSDAFVDATSTFVFLTDPLPASVPLSQPSILP
jgi:hypothetical protein